MRIHYLQVHHFRGIEHLDWKVRGNFVCLVGPGDSTKSTVLDAIEFALLPRWNPSFDDTDFNGTDTSKPISITVTVGDLPQEFMDEDQFGLELRGWSETDGLHDEPLEGDAPVLSIRLVVDESLEPKWTVVNDRKPDGRTISHKDRERLGMARLGSSFDWHLSWRRGSVLSRITDVGGDKADGIALILAGAARAAREGFEPGKLTVLSDAARKAQELAQDIGVSASKKYQPHLDFQSVNVNLGGVALHDGDIPLRKVGLGSRRLLSVALQREVAKSGGVTRLKKFRAEPRRYRIETIAGWCLRMASSFPKLSELASRCHTQWRTGWVPEPAATRVSFWRPALGRAGTGPGNGGNGPAQTPSVLFLFEEGVCWRSKSSEGNPARPVWALRAGPRASASARRTFAGGAAGHGQTERQHTPAYGTGAVGTAVDAAARPGRGGGLACRRRCITCLLKSIHMDLIPAVESLRPVEERVRIAEATLARQLDWISRADNKASFVIGLETAMVGVLAAVATPPRSWDSALTVLVCSALALLAVGFHFIYSATFPELSGPPESLIFFGRIAQLPYDHFEVRAANQTLSEYLADLLRQCHQNAVIADKKYRYVKGSYQMLSLAAVPWALTVYSFRIMSR
jgi:hypothetical protein